MLERRLTCWLFPFRGACPIFDTLACSRLRRSPHRGGCVETRREAPCFHTSTSIHYAASPCQAWIACNSSPSLIGWLRGSPRQAWIGLCKTGAKRLFCTILSNKVSAAGARTLNTSSITKMAGDYTGQEDGSYPVDSDRQRRWIRPASRAPRGGTESTTRYSRLRL
jgi:hypothetical protein